jgi:hypothetical protein
MSGSNLQGQTGRYGTLGIAAPGNVPGSRTNPVAWADAAGDLWLFGGQGTIRPRFLYASMRQEARGSLSANDLLEVQRGRMDVDGRFESYEPIRHVRNAGNCCCPGMFLGRVGLRQVRPMRWATSGCLAGVITIRSRLAESSTTCRSTGLKNTQQTWPTVC